MQGERQDVDSPVAEKNNEYIVFRNANERMECL